MSTNPESDQHLQWAFEALVNYAAFRVQGDAPGIIRTTAIPPDWPKDRIPLLEDLWESEDRFDYEHADYLLVRQVMAVQIRDNPQDVNLPDFITHCLYHRRPVGEFEVFQPFGTQKVQIQKIDKTVAVNAWFAVTKLLKSLAAEKAKRDDILRAIHQGGLENFREAS